MWFDVAGEGKSVEPGQPIPNAEFRAAGAGYFRAAGIPLIQGRAFADTDGPVMIINQALADQLFAREDPLGKRIAVFDVVRFTWRDWRTVVGVVGNTRDGGLDAEPRPAMFIASVRGYGGFLGGGLVIRADKNVAALIPVATSIVKRFAPTALIERVATIAQTRDKSVSPRRLNATLIASFDLLALLIATVGIAGVLAFSVSARTNEIGIRMSLGADAGQVQRMVLGEGSVLLALGLALGIGGAFGFAGVIRGLLFGIAPHDPVTFIGAAVTMAAIGIGACWVPAMRAARVDPAVTMRTE